MEIAILIYHLGIVPCHSFYGCEHRFLDLGGIMPSFQGFLHFTTPISVGNGILFGGPTKQREAELLVLWFAEFSPNSVMLPMQGVIPSAVPVS